MPIGWYIVPYRESKHGSPFIPGCPGREVDINRFNDDIIGNGGYWSETEVLGGYAVVKVRTTQVTLDMLDTVYFRIPVDNLTDTLVNLNNAAINSLKGRIRALGYSNTEINNELPSDWRLLTLEQVLNFVAKRRLKPRWDGQKIVLDGPEQRCKPIKTVDLEVAG